MSAYEMRISDWSSDVCSSDLGCVWMDAAMGFVGAVVIARWSWGLMQNTAAVLVDATVTGELEQEIRDAIEDGDAQIADLHVWQLGPGKFGAIVSLIVDTPLPPEAYIQRLRGHDEVVHVTVETRLCPGVRSEEHTSELQSLMRISYAVFCLKKNNYNN